MEGLSFHVLGNLSEVLKQLGVVDAFSCGNADFSGISEGKELYIADVFHKAYIDVNENGTEAAAATVIRKDLRCCSWVDEFFVDRPFVFSIMKDDNVWFTGRVGTV